MNIQEAKAILEAVIFAAPEPITLKECAGILGVGEQTAELLIQQLEDDYRAQKRGLTLRRVAGGFQIATRPEYSEYVKLIGRAPKTQQLSQAALECLAIVAYRQPITRVEIDEIRGVKSESPLQTLLERELITEVGRKDTVGRPVLFGTTKKFLEVFGLKDLDELPPLEDDAEMLLTLEPTPGINEPK
ncbi:MAG: SMC-Scp complex subunit ScpB [Firmicutes bacterium]|nr:SMC-Scp complex subunit ScpB [Bacillota bacterium]